MSTDSRILLGMVLTVLLMAAALFVGPRIILTLACDRDEDRKALDAQTDFVCAEDHKVLYDAWSECGLKKECSDPISGKTDGSYFAAQGGHLQSKSLYSQGRETGGWTWFDSNGKPYPENGGYKSPARPVSPQ